MRLAEGVEWGIHCCVNLAWLHQETPVTNAHLAAQFDLPAAYLNKCLQALVKAGILTSTAGARGGYALARRPQDISLLDIVMAIEGFQPAFRCQEIRRRGVGASMPPRDFVKPCAIAAAMHRAEVAWRKELSITSLAGIMATIPAKAAKQARRFVQQLRDT